MTVASPGFLALLLVLLLIFHATSRAGLRAFILSAAGLTFFLAQSKSLQPLVPVLAFVLGSFAASVLLSRLPSTPLRAVLIATHVSTFVVLKRYWFVPLTTWSAAISTVGLSYILFRALHVLAEAGDTFTVRAQDLPAFLRYQLGCFTLLAGPIQRFDEFREQDDATASLALDGDLCASQLLRVTTGLLKIVLVAPLLLFQFHEWQSLPAFWSASLGVLFVAWIYVNFSGYMDVVVGSARLFGYRLPENFDQPWMARDFVDFWSRWHITMSNFFRDYVFYPLMSCVGRITSRRVALTAASAVVSFLVFFLLGLWHGTTRMFVWLGLFLAAGVSLQRLFRFKGPALLEHLWGALALVYFGAAAVTIWPTSTNLAAADLVWAKMATRSGLLGVGAATVLVATLRLITVAANSWNPRVPNAMVQALIAVEVVAMIAVYRLLAAGINPMIFYEKF